MRNKSTFTATQSITQPTKPSVMATFQSQQSNRNPSGLSPVPHCFPSPNLELFLLELFTATQSTTQPAKPSVTATFHSQQSYINPSELSPVPHLPVSLVQLCWVWVAFLLLILSFSYWKSPAILQRINLRRDWERRIKIQPIR